MVDFCYGECWVSYWFDIVCFGEMYGFEMNCERFNVYYYCDYVINVFNDGKLYD